MSKNLFGTDGVRGLANSGDMSPEIAFRIGAAITYQAMKRAGGTPRIVVGKDTRLSGYLFETAVASGICALGGEVLLCGPLPTPAIAHLTTSMRASAGVVISASHNAYQDNGIKLFGPDGRAKRGRVRRADVLATGNQGRIVATPDLTSPSPDTFRVSPTGRARSRGRVIESGPLNLRTRTH